MTKLDQIKILDNKIKANRAQFMLDRKNAEISAKSSGELDKYEYLTGEDLGYKPDALTQEKFEYSPLGKVFTAGLDKDDKKEGLFKRLKSIEDKTTTHPKLSRGFFPQLPYGKRDDGDDGNTGQYKILDDIKKNLRIKFIWSSQPMNYLTESSELQRILRGKNMSLIGTISYNLGSLIATTKDLSKIIWTKRLNTRTLLKKKNLLTLVLSFMKKIKTMVKILKNK